jgi:uncharacterized membrane protein
MTGRTRLSIGSRIAPARFLLFAVLLIAVAGGDMAWGARPHMALLIGFDVAASIFLASLWPLLSADVGAMRRTAAANDANRVGLLIISVLLSLVVLVAIGTLIARSDTLHWPDILLIVATLIISWIFANMVFALHYAHLYYLQAHGRDRCGLTVPDTAEPGYWDFVYFAFTLGMTFQTSDITINGAHMRHVVLGHSMAAFLFNMGILAFTVNALGGL